jgi:hypothetical protein
MLGSNFLQRKTIMNDQPNLPQTDAEKEPKPTRAKASVNDDIALLSLYGLAELPEVFAMRDGNNVIQEREPCYICQADGFYGRGTHGTWHQEGEILVMEPRFVPNQHLQPLNRAAGVAYAKWLHSLPNNQVPIDIGDMAEAAQMLAKNPQVTDLPPDDYQKAVTTLAMKLKLKRDGKDARMLPNMSPHNFAPQSGGNSPPILGAKMSDMTQRGPGFTATGPGAPTGQAGVRRAQAAPAALGGQPPR